MADHVNFISVMYSMLFFIKHVLKQIVTMEIGHTRHLWRSEGITLRTKIDVKIYMIFKSLSFST